VVASLAKLLDDREQMNAGATRDPAARARYVVAHAALRQLLGRAVGADPASVHFRYSCAVCGSHEHGRPELDGFDGVSFSLSHSTDVAVIAIAAVPVGADVEVVRSRRHLDRVAARLMPPDALARWQAMPDADRRVAFFALWTQKEAHLKLLGVGITRALRDVHPTNVTTWDDWPAGCVTSLATHEPVAWTRHDHPHALELGL
jgi:4'-phosphopantetheinyl transferase